MTEPEAVSNHRRNRYLWVFTFIILTMGILWFLIWYLYLQFYMSTDDAYSGGSKIHVNASIPGSVTAFFADDTDFVVEGQLLVQLDSTHYQLAYEKALAALRGEVLKIRELYDEISVRQAEVEVKKASLSKARFDFDNRAVLINSKAVSNEEYIHSRDSLNIAENEMKRAEYQLKVAQDKVGDTSLQDHPRILEKKAEVQEAYYFLKHCLILAPSTGYIAQRAVNVGQGVTPQTSLMAIIPAHYVWVDANFKETELKNMRVGQPASVWFDLYGSDVKFEGKVLGIASGTGSVFSLIPPQNATGNWIKIVQRLPVRISLNPEMVQKYPIRLGISAEVSVDISNQQLPFLKEIPSTKPIEKTYVYDINMTEVNKIIEQIIE